MATESLISLDSHPSPTLVSLTFLHAGEGQSVLAHELTGERAGLMFDAEAYEAQLRGADGEVHVSVPVRSQSCRSDRSLMLYHLFHCTLITKQRKELGLRARGPGSRTLSWFCYSLLFKAGHKLWSGAVTELLLLLTDLIFNILDAVSRFSLGLAVAGLSWFSVWSKYFTFITIRRDHLHVKRLTFTVEATGNDWPALQHGACSVEYFSICGLFTGSEPNGSGSVSSPSQQPFWQQWASTLFVFIKALNTNSVQTARHQTKTQTRLVASWWG